MRSLRGENSPQPLGPALWDWETVERVLLIRLRSIGDTVLATPSLFALKRFLPNASIDILLEDWVAPVLDGHPHVDNVLSLTKGSATSRVRMARRLRANRYDVVYNLHGGTTATFLTRASGAKHRVGYTTYQYPWLHTDIAPSPKILWSRDKLHSVEQQLGMLGWTGVPVSDRPPTKLAITDEPARAIDGRLRDLELNDTAFAVIHPAAAFATKQWPVRNFVSIAEQLQQHGLAVVVVTTNQEAATVDEIRRGTSRPVSGLTDLTLPEVTALLSRARLFLGNDSGIAHMAAALNTPAVVIFGSSNRIHWSPWATNAAEAVFEEMECQPCHGYFCEQFDEPECIKRVPVEKVRAAVERVLRESATR